MIGFSTTAAALAALIALSAGLSAGPALAQADAGQTSQHRTNLLDLKLGTPAKDLPEEAFIDYACGTMGGPPSLPIGGFTDYAKCPAEKSGLHEVEFRYDDELEYRLLARGDTSDAETNGGTKVSAYPAIVSALFDDKGILRGLRAVTDTRVDLRDRSMSYLMADAVRNMYGMDGWNCTNHPPAQGEEPISGNYINQTCSKTTEGELIYTEAHLFRRAGETEVNRDTGRTEHGSFESSARIEIREAGAPVDDKGRPL
ncbi:MAG TPA: hypothetical protein VHB74_03325 [Devosia sp.]|nr:hypothetical protein [Devosia sp.]